MLLYFLRIRIYCVPAIICFTSVYLTNAKLVTLCIVILTGSPRWVDCLAPYESIRVKCLSQRRNVTLPSSETEPRVDTSGLPTSALLSCTTAGWMLASNVFPMDITAICLLWASNKQSNLPQLIVKLLKSSCVELRWQI